MNLDRDALIIGTWLEERRRRRLDLDLGVLEVQSPGQRRGAGEGLAAAEEEGECCVLGGVRRALELGVEGEQVRDGGGDGAGDFLTRWVADAELGALDLGLGLYCGDVQVANGC